MDSDKFWSWAWAANPNMAHLGTSHLSDDVVTQDVAIHVLIGCADDGDRRARFWVGYLVGYGTEPNRQLSDDEKEYVAALLRLAADNILRGKFAFQEGE